MTRSILTNNILGVVLVTSLLNYSSAAFSSPPGNSPGSQNFDHQRYLDWVSKYHSDPASDSTLPQWPVHESALPGSGIPGGKMGPPPFISPAEKSETAAHFLDRGIIAHENQQYKEAEKNYLKAVTMDPDFAEAHFNLGILYARTKKLDKAEEEYKTALRLDPDMNEVHNNLGVVYAAQKKYTPAESEFKKALKKNPKDAKAHLNLGHFYYYLMNNLLKAQKQYNLALELGPELKQAHENLGKINEELKRSQKREKRFENSRAVDLEYSEGHQNWGDSEEVDPMEEALLPAPVEGGQNEAPLF